ncbi:WGR domain-containing protein [Methylobacterium sp. NMS12]|uniref:WGR domain-containing protein n=1 Tax=Methylobacterium sp. NMS12 TaxID=3079766 RepID=UPI003F882BB0
MQRYELTAGSSAKFWEAGTEDSVLIVRFGRIGTQGQSKTKQFPSAQAAQAERDRLVREKTGKGYRPAGDPAPAEPDPASGIEATARAADARGADPESAEAPPAPAASAEAPRVPIFTGTPLPTRGRPGAPLDAAADWAAFAARIRPLLADAPDEARAPAEALAARLDGAPPALDPDEVRAWLERVEAACPALSQRPWGAKPGPQGPAARAAFTHLARWLVARSGTGGTLVALLDRLRPRPSGRYGSLPVSAWDIPTTSGLRAALVAAPEAAYAEALDAALRLAAAEPEPTLSRWLAAVFADDRPGADHALSAGAVLARCDPPDPKAYGNSHVALPLIVDLPPAQAAPWYAAPYHRATLATCDVGAEEAAATVIAVADVAGEPATAGLVWLLEGAVGPERTIVARALLETRAADALDTLLPFVGTKLVRDALDAADAAFPDWMLRSYLGALQGKGEPAYGPRAVTLAARHGHETARAWAAADGARGAGRLDRLLAAGSAPQAAPEAALPPVLRDPPWRRRGAARARSERAVAPIPTPFAHGFDPDEALDRSTFYFEAGTLVESMTDLAARIRATEAEALYDMPIPPPAEPVPAADADPATALAWLDRRLDLDRDAFTGFFYFNYGPWFRMVGWQPEPLALMLWEQTGPQRAHYVAWRRTIAVMLSRFGARAVPGLVRLVAADPAQLLPEVEPVDAADLAPVAARAFHRTRKLRPAAAAWLRAHPRTAALRLLPETLGPAGPDRDAADAALRFLAAEPAGRAALDAAVAAYAERDPGVPGAVAAGVDSDPLEQVPSKPPKLPDWVVPAALPRPVLRSGGALPDAAVAALCEMLAFSDPLTPYAGVAQVRAACTPESLDAFAVALFQAWIAAGAKATGEWAMLALALIGGDHAARDLTRQIRAWGQAGLKPRGRAGIAVLAGIGTDVALMNLSAIAEKSPLLQLREAARAAIVDAAEARGLDEVDLADRLSPISASTRGAGSTCPSGSAGSGSASTRP